MESQCKTHGLTPFREVWPTACRCVQRLAAEAALPVYHDSTGFARVTLICKKKRPEPKFGSLFGAEDGTFPRANQQSTGLLVPALRCRRPVPTCGARIRLRVLCRLPSSTAAPAPAPCIRRRRRSPLQQALSSEYQKETPLAGYANGVSFWCGRWDLNPHVIDTRTSNVPVCRFQHFRKSHLTARKILAHLGV